MTPPLSAEAVRRMTAYAAPKPRQDPQRGITRPTPSEVARRRASSLEARAKGDSMEKIAIHLGVSRTAVRQYLVPDIRKPKTPARMKCPACHRIGWCEVIDTRGKSGVITRRRECSCGARFSTVETVQP